jgi:hypothetical protein
MCHLFTFSRVTATTERRRAKIDVQEQMSGLVSLFEGGVIFAEQSGNRTSNHAGIDESNRELEGREVSEGHDVTSGAF